jgi:hypothetical protein
VASISHVRNEESKTAENRAVSWYNLLDAKRTRSLLISILHASARSHFLRIEPGNPVRTNGALYLARL